MGFVWKLGFLGFIFDFRVLGLSRDTKYLNPRSRLWIIERDSQMHK